MEGEVMNLGGKSQQPIPGSAGVQSRVPGRPRP